MMGKDIMGEGNFLKPSHIEEHFYRGGRGIVILKNGGLRFVVCVCVLERRKGS